MGTARAESVNRLEEWQLFWWAMVAAWLLVIWQFGRSQVLPLSSSYDLMRWLLRKGLHLAVYSALGGLLSLAMGFERKGTRIGSLCFLIALLDELHQSLVPHRSFHTYDLSIDFGSALLGMLFVRRALTFPLWRKERLFGV